MEKVVSPKRYFPDAFLMTLQSCLITMMSFYQWESLLDNHAEKRYFIFFSEFCHPYHQISLALRLERLVLTHQYSDINALILDYLTLGGYPNSAAKFSKEANLPHQQDISSMQAREEIRNYIHNGDIQTAIESLNELDPEVRFRLSFFIALVRND